MQFRAERAARNEALFRDVNERISETSLAWEGERLSAMCECHQLQCAETIEVTRAEYEAVRATGDRFLLVDGHKDEEIERVVDRTDRFVVVEKLGMGAQLARELHPRE